MGQNEWKRVGFSEGRENRLSGCAFVFPRHDGVGFVAQTRWNSWRRPCESRTCSKNWLIRRCCWPRSAFRFRFSLNALRFSKTCLDEVNMSQHHITFDVKILSQCQNSQSRARGMEERKRVNELKHGIAQKKAATAIQARGSFVHLHKLPAVYMKLLSLLCSALVQLLHAVALIRMNAAILFRARHQGKKGCTAQEEIAKCLVIRAIPQNGIQEDE